MTNVFHFKLALDERGYVKIVAYGDASVSDIENMYQSVLEYSKQQETEKVMFDAVNVNLSYPMDQFLPLMERLSAYLSSLKVARVVKAEGFRQDLIETVSHKLNLDLRNFSCSEQANDWLVS
jgi:hypothetical protein